MSPGSEIKTGIRLALCVAVLTVSVWGYSQQPPWMKQYQKARLQLRHGDTAAADELFKACWKAYPRDFVLSNAIGAALDATGHHRSAIPWYQRAIKANPHFVPAYNNLALSYAVRGKLENAVPLLTKATEIDPRNEEAFYNLGLVRMQMGENTAATADLDRARVLSPRNAAVLSKLAVAYLRSGQRSKGLRVIHGWVQRSGDQSGTTLLAAQILNAAGLYREALAQIAGLGKTGALSPALAFENANALFHLGRYQETVNFLEDKRSQIPRNLEYDLLLGSAQALAGKLPEAVKTLQIAVRKAPQNPQTYYRLALVLMQGYRDRDALQALSAGLQQIPNSALLWYTKGVVDETAGRYEDSVNALQRSLSARPNQPEVWSMLGGLYARIGGYGKAMKSYRTAMGYGAAPEVAAKYAELLIQFHRLIDAEAVLRQVSAKHPSEPNLYRAWGEWYSAKKEYARAETFLRRSIDLNEKDYQSHFLLAQVLEQLGKPEAAKEEFAAAARIKQQTRESGRLLKRTLVPLLSASSE